MYPIILASNSPRRKELLTQMGVAFTAIASKKEEVTTKIRPYEVVMELSKLKAEDVAETIANEAIIIGSDTIVAIGEHILGKPKNQNDAFDMLSLLSGQTHQVYTGVTLIKKEADGKTETRTFYETTNVTIANMSNEEITSYILTKEYEDKAGAYAIQGKFAPFVQQIEGDYYTIVGLPLAHLYQELKKLNKD